MSNKQNFIDVVKNHKKTDSLAFWELHFHLWNKYSSGFVSGEAFNLLAENKKLDALKRDAEIIKEVGERLRFSCVSIPDNPWDCIYTLPNKYRLILIDEISKLKPDFAITGSCGGVISPPATSNDYMDFCYKIFDDPEEIDEMCEGMYVEWLAMVDEFIDAGMDFITVASDVADNKNVFFNPEQMNRWYLPYLKKHVDYAHKRGIGVILHTDGNINSILTELEETGIDGLQAIDPIAGMSLENVLKYYDGRVAACGNLDCGLMLNGTPDEVYEEAKRILNKCKGYSGFVFGNSNAVVEDTPKENYDAYLSAISG